MGSGLPGFLASKSLKTEFSNQPKADFFNMLSPGVFRDEMTRCALEAQQFVICDRWE